VGDKVRGRVDDALIDKMDRIVGTLVKLARR